MRRWNSRRALAVSVLLGIGLAARAGHGTTVPLTESRVKALFLLNFARYVEWPAESFENASSPIVIGVAGQDGFSDDLAAAVEGKFVEGRPVVARPIHTWAERETCQILFIRASEKAAVPEILRHIKARPVLSVGESDHFTQLGGMIDFVKRDGKVRLEINLEAAREGRLKISAKLLNVADVVTGKAN